MDGQGPKGSLHMNNPYFIDEPAAISFSGGRTSAYMLYQILQAHDGKLPDDVFVTFANTGREMPETLDFVRDCALYWNVDITWLELGEYEQTGIWKSGSKEGKPRYKASTVVVDYDTAARNGEPFARLVKKRRYLPNIMSRFCTAELKVRRIRDFLKGKSMDKWTQYIGIRGDEPRRAVKMHGQMNEGHEMFLPLYVLGVTKMDVHNFWKAQPFDLQLFSNDGTTDWGNCDLCFLKGGRKKLSLIRERPDLAKWWIDIEDGMTEQLAGTAARFRNDQPSYEEMLIIATDQQNMFSETEDNDTIPCFCGE
jgi:3'-phosphoadenosine 5'-phosphosulfate sulfotransferase (PAPS reductase)/FAD synthetase